jgi:erythromycin esterase-like protein
MYPLKHTQDLDALIDDIADSSVVMLGEASHGTHEYYTWRATITQRLILEKGFNFIAVEGDWPDCYNINRYIKSYDETPGSAKEVLMKFDRWPTWMWANWEIAALADWLKQYNSTLEADKKVGFYGLDVYSLWDSMREIVNYLEKEDPAAAVAVRQAIQCFQPYEENEEAYARVSLTKHSCRDKVLNLLREIRSRAQHLSGDREAGFSTEQNALIAVNAENYYRSMMSFDNESWNVRDRHMMETLDRLLKFHGSGAKAVVWEHNTHIGDARATDMARAGMINLGQLAREQYGGSGVYLVGFGSYEGTVIASQGWGSLMQVMKVPPAREGSIEDLLHKEEAEDRYLLFSKGSLAEKLKNSILHRAIGVVYNPAGDRYGNYTPSVMPKRYDAFVFLDKTTSLHPMHLRPHYEKVPETYPFGF